MQTSIKKSQSSIWYSIGSLVYALSYIVLTIFVVRQAGGESGGIFTFGLSTLGQHIFLLTYFGIRTIHITDVKRRYSFQNYLENRHCSVFVSLIISIAVAFCVGYTFVDGKFIHNMDTSKIVFALLLLNICEGLFDVYDCEMQRMYQINVAGRSILFRSLVYDFILIYTLIKTNNLVLSVYLALAGRVLIAIIYKLKYFKDVKYNKIFNITDPNVKKLFVEAFPLAMSVFFDFYVFASTKYFVNYLYTPIENGFYGILFMPASLMMVLLTFIIRPEATNIANEYAKMIDNEENEYETKRINLYKKIALIAIGLIIIAIILGPIGLNIVNKLTDFAYNDLFEKGFPILILTVIAGGIYSMTTIPYTILTIKQNEKYIFFTYLICVCISTVVSYICIKYFGLIGAGVAHIINLLWLFFLLYRKERINN